MLSVCFCGQGKERHFPVRSKERERERERKEKKGDGKSASIESVESIDECPSKHQARLQLPSEQRQRL